MVKKLFKHEFLFYARVMAIVYGILLTIATANRVIQIFENESIAYTIISVFSGITYGVSVIAALGFAFVLGITRFHKNLFTSEGYLTLTLPAAPHQHIAVKAITAVCVELISLVVILISVCIISAGEMLKEIIIALRYFVGELYQLVGNHMVTVGLEFILLMLIACFASIMLYYTFIALGQLSKKNRILAAVGAYFAYYILTQVVSTVISIVFSVFAENGMLIQWGAWIADNFAAAVHIGMWSAIVIMALFTMVEFLVIRWVITKKLNLE